MRSTKQELPPTNVVFKFYIQPSSATLGDTVISPQSKVFCNASMEGLKARHLHGPLLILETVRRTCASVVNLQRVC